MIVAAAVSREALIAVFRKVGKEVRVAKDLS